MIEQMRQKLKQILAVVASIALVISGASEDHAT